MVQRLRLAFWAFLVVLVVFAVSMPGSASSHREAPLISQDPLADNTDVYAFVSPASPDKVTLISNFIPLQLPASGPNFWKFDDNVLYEIMIDNNGDASEDVTFQFRFRTEVGNPNTFLYNTGQITSLDDPDWNVKQFYSVTRVDGPRRTGHAEVLAEDVPSPPVNVGNRSLPDYDSVANDAIRTLDNGIKVFAGQRDDGFYVNLGVFDLLGVPPVDNNTPDSIAGLNVHSIALEVPITMLTANHRRPTSATGKNAVIGVWSTASRQQLTVRTPPGQVQKGPYIQVSRLGQPLVNEVVIPMGLKDTFNSIPPTKGRRRASGGSRSRSAKAALRALRHPVAAGAPQRPGHDLPDRYPGTEPAAQRQTVGNAAPERRDSTGGVAESAWRARRRPGGVPERAPCW